MWDIGLRPVFKPLVKMANNLSVEKRIKIKGEWCDIFEEMFSEFVKNYSTNMEEAFEYLFVIRKNK
jgi:uncharacterized Rmd1/YagE family protein